VFQRAPLSERVHALIVCYVAAWSVVMYALCVCCSCAPARDGLQMNSFPLRRGIHMPLCAGRTDDVEGGARATRWR
jgi:hypothetical protein